MQLSAVFVTGWLWPVAAALLLVLAIRWLFRLVWELRHLPPGPWGLPIVGYLPWTDQHAYLTFDQLRTKYGSIFSVKLGPQTAIILADWKAVKATLVDKPKVFSGRPAHHTFDTATGRRTVSFNDGKVWSDQRNLMMKCLRKVGVGRKSMENVISQSVENIMDYLAKRDNHTVAIEAVLFKNIMGIAWRMVASKRCVDGKEDDEFEKWVCNNMNTIRANNPLNFMPWLRFIPPDGFGYWRFIRNNQKILDYLTKEIEAHLSRWKEGQVEDFIDAYIEAIQNQEAVQNSKKDGHLNVRHLTASLWDLFMAGADTATATTLWGLLYISLWPQVQKKAQHELDTVIGRTRLPCLDDFQSGRLPYVDAMIMEIHRYSSIVPLSLAHCPLDTTTVLGYTIPKRIPCFQSIYGIHHDPQLWVEPEKFNPERFIDANNEAKWPPFLMPYSIGPRLCPGENLAQQELHLIFSCLLHRFNFSIPPGHQTPSLTPEISLVIRPHPYELLVQTRNC